MGVHVIKKCEDCGKEGLFHIARKRCPSCAELREDKTIFEKTCDWSKCKKPFTTRRKKQRFCTNQCKTGYHSDIYYANKAKLEKEKANAKTR